MTRLFTAEEMPGIDLATYKAKPCAYVHQSQMTLSADGPYDPSRMPVAALSQHSGPVMLNVEPITGSVEQCRMYRTAMFDVDVIQVKCQPFVYSPLLSSNVYWSDPFDVKAEVAMMKANRPYWAMLKQQAFLSGACYLPYVGDEQPYLADFNQRFITRCCDLAEHAAEELGKDDWSMTVWNHYLDALDNGCRLKGHVIPKQELADYIGPIVDRGPARLIHWGARSWFKTVAAMTDDQAVWLFHPNPNPIIGIAFRDIWRESFAADPRSDVEVWSEAMGVYRAAILEAA